MESIESIEKTRRPLYVEMKNTSPTLCGLFVVLQDRLHLRHILRARLANFTTSNCSTATFCSLKASLRYFHPVASHSRRDALSLPRAELLVSDRTV